MIPCISVYKYCIALLDPHGMPCGHTCTWPPYPQFAVMMPAVDAGGMLRLGTLIIVYKHRSV